MFIPVLPGNELFLIYLLYSNRFCQVSRLVHIKTFLDGSVVGDELKDNGDWEHGEFVIFPWNADDHVCNALVDSGIFRDEEDHISTSRFHLADIRDRLCENMLLGRDRDDRNMVCDQSDGSVLQLTGCVSLRMNVGDLFQL